MDKIIAWLEVRDSCCDCEMPHDSKSYEEEANELLALLSTPPPSTDPSGVVALEGLAFHMKAMDCPKSAKACTDALALIQSLTKERDSLLDGMREIAEEKFRTVGELRAIATRHIEGAGE